jgi:hypothetical protein
MPKYRSLPFTDDRAYLAGDLVHLMPPLVDVVDEQLEWLERTFTASLGLASSSPAPQPAPAADTEYDAQLLTAGHSGCPWPEGSEERAEWEAALAKMSGRKAPNPAVLAAYEAAEATARTELEQPAELEPTGDPR